MEKSQTQIPLDRIVVIILGGGEGKRLFPLTKTYCKPAMSFGGRYRLIDIPISHSLASGLNRIYVIGQYLTYSLQKHLFRTYPRGIHNEIELLVPEERNNEKVWFKGTADAIRQNVKYLSEIAADYFLILSGDQLYNINFQEMIRFAMEINAGLVIAAQPVTEKNAKRMGILKIEHGGTRLVAFTEKPTEKNILDQFRTDDFTLNKMGYQATQEQNYLGSMGIYLFKRHTLFQLLRDDPREDFGKHLITTEMKKNDVHIFLYDGYWEDIGTIESYYQANLDLTQPDSMKRRLNCYDEASKIVTQHYNLPGAKIAETLISHSLICEGSIVDAKEVIHSIVGVRSHIGKGSIIRDSILVGNEYYERPPLAYGESSYLPGVGDNCIIEKAIIDANVRIGNNVRLVNQNNEVFYDDPYGRLYVRDGILIVPRGTEIQDNFVF